MVERKWRHRYSVAAAHTADTVMGHLVDYCVRKGFAEELVRVCTFKNTSQTSNAIFD